RARRGGARRTRGGEPARRRPVAVLRRRAQARARWPPRGGRRATPARRPRAGLRAPRAWSRQLANLGSSPVRPLWQRKFIGRLDGCELPNLREPDVVTGRVPERRVDPVGALLRLFDEFHATALELLVRGSAVVRREEDRAREAERHQLAD